MKTGWLVWECVVFAIFIGASTLAPLWSRRKDAAAGSSAKSAYIFAGGGVSTLAMILSVARGTLGVRSFLGFPSELVYRGTAMWETLYGIILAFPIVCWVFVPVYYRLHTNSVYEYLQMRFNCSWVRRLAAATFLIRQLLNLAVTVYTPTVALHAVLALPHWASAAALTAVGIVFNLLGGLAAAIRADVIQTLTMILVSGAFIVQATVRAGGPKQVLDDNVEGGRLKFFQFSMDPTVRVDTLSAIFGQMFMSISIYGCQQTFVQRYCSMSSEARVRRTLFANVPAVTVLFSLSWVVGMALYAVYKTCDPLASGVISAPDEVLPFYVEDQFTFLPGMLGLFLGSLFNGALSFLVSNVNSLATVTWEDFVSAAPPFKDINDKQQLTVIKIIGVIYAIVIMLLSLCVGMVGGVVEGSLLVTSATSGALLGVFTLAALCPIANGKGALCGIIASHFITIWMATGRLLYVDKKVDMLPVSTEGCLNSTINIFKETPVLLSPAVNKTLLHLAPLLQTREMKLPVEDSFYESNLYKMYAVSYMWYAVIGTIACVVIGIIVGALTGTDSDKFDERLLHPFVAKIYRKYPGKKRTFSTKKPENEKESSVKTEVTTSDDVKNDVGSISEIKPEKYTKFERSSSRFTINNSVPLESNGSVPVGPNSSVPVGPNSSVPVGPNSSVPVGPNSSVPVGPNTSVPVGPNSTVPVGPNSSVPVGPNTSVPVGPNSTVPVGPNSSVPVGPNTSIPNVSNNSVPRVSGNSVPKESVPVSDDAEIPELDVSLSSSNCRLFDAYDANTKQSPIPVKSIH